MNNWVNIGLGRIWTQLSIMSRLSGFSQSLINISMSLSEPMATYTGRGSEGRLNKKDGLTRYGHSHVKDKTS